MTSGQFPAHWALTTLGHVLREPLRNGHSAKATGTNEGVPTLTLSAVTSGDFSDANIKLTTADPMRVRDLWLEPEDVLIERSNTAELVGTARVFPGPSGLAIFPDLIIRARLVPELDVGMIGYWLMAPSVRHFYRTRAQGIAGSMPKIDQSTVEATPIPLPPCREQRTLAAALDSYLSRLDDVVATLERVQRNLKRYRASVLKAAVEGRLVPTEAELARKEGRDYEPADALLQRILEERKARWIEGAAEEARARAEKKAKKAGKPWSDADDRAALEKGRKAAAKKYVAPEPADTSELPELPKGWCWTTVDALAAQVRYGTSAKTNAELKDGVPVLRMGNIVEGRLDLSNLKYLPADHDEFPDQLLTSGELLFNRTNSAELVGKTAVFRERSRPVAAASYLIRVELLGGVMPEFVSSFINAPAGRHWIASVVSQQVGQANVNGTKLKACALPLPPLNEQQRIVAEMERLLSLAFATEADAARNAERAARLRQSILKWAFEGRLVDQDPNDEPASALLERIAADRAQAEAKHGNSKARRKAPKKKKTA